MRHVLEKPRLGLWIVSSVAAHLAVVAFSLFLFFEREETVNQSHVIEVHIVQKGKKRDEKLLPRLVAEQPKVEVEEPVHETKPAPPEEIQKHQIKPKEKKTPPPKPNVNVLDTLKRHLKPEEKEGNPDALEGGNSVMGELTDQYIAIVSAKIKANFRLINMMTDREKRTLKVFIKLFIDADGHPINTKIVRKSKSADYDEAVRDRISEITTFGAPPLPLRKQLKKDGLEFALCPGEECPE